MDHGPELPTGRQLDSVIASIQAHLARGIDHVVVLQHPVARPGDAWLARAPIRLTTSGDRVYCFLDSRSGLSPDYIASALGKMSDAVTTLAFFGTTAVDFLCNWHPAVFDRVLDDVAATTSQFVVSAFDGEVLLYASTVAEPVAALV